MTPQPPQSDPVSGSPAVTPEAVKRAHKAIVQEVGKHLWWNVHAYGKAWTEEDGDTEFIVGDSAAKALAAAHPEPMVPASELEKAQAENARLRERFETYRSAAWAARKKMQAENDPRLVKRTRPDVVTEFFNLHRAEASVSDEANIPDEAVSEAWTQLHYRQPQGASVSDVRAAVIAAAPAIRQQAIRDVCDALRHRWPSSIGVVTADLIEREFLPDTSPKEKR